MLPTDRWRLPLAGAVLGAVAALGYHLVPQVPPDFRQWWTAGRAILAGVNPYTVIHPPAFAYPWFYPLPAGLVVLPVAWLPLVLAHVAWSAAGGFALGLAANRRPGLGPALVSLPFLTAAGEGHWSPFLLAACAVPALECLWVAKPSVGLAYFAGYGSRQAVVACTLLVALSLVILPRWPLDWLATLHGTVSVPPITRPGGFLLLLGFLRWRTPEGRLLGMLALVPQTTVPYEVLAVFCCARSKRDGYVLAVLSAVAVTGHYLVSGIPLTVPEQARTVWPWLLGCCYLPALWMVCRPVPTPTDDHADARPHPARPVPRLRAGRRLVDGALRPALATLLRDRPAMRDPR